MQTEKSFISGLEKSLVQQKYTIETFRFEDENDYENDI